MTYVSDYDNYSNWIMHKSMHQVRIHKEELRRFSVPTPAGSYNFIINWLMANVGPGRISTFEIPDNLEALAWYIDWYQSQTEDEPWGSLSVRFHSATHATLFKLTWASGAVPELSEFSMDGWFDDNGIRYKSTQGELFKIR